MFRRIAFFATIALAHAHFAAAQQRVVVINEVMFAPVKPESEWIELLNTTADTIDIAGWTLSVHAHTPVVVPNSNALLAPDSMVILTTNDSGLAELRNIPRDRIIRMPVPDLNNSGSTISLYDTSGNLIDSMFYDGNWIKADGISVERIDPTTIGYSATNWGACIDSSGCTILRLNSIRERAHELAITSAISLSSSAQISVANLGGDTAENFEIGLTIANFTPILHSVATPVPSHDTLIVTIPLPDSIYGVFPAIAYLIDSSNEADIRDSIAFHVFVPIPEDSVVINEIMFSPQPNGSQWLELYNLSSSWISMDSSKLLVGESHPGIYSHTIPPLLIPPDSFGLISANDSILSDYLSLSGRSGIASLNLSMLDFGKDSCFVVLHNQDSTTIDSVHYFKSWQQSLIIKNFTGISLERINPSGPSNDPNNWHASLDSATPLERNSVDTSVTPPNEPPPASSFQSSFSPNPFSPYDFPTTDTLIVQTGDENNWALRVRIYDGHGRMVRLLTPSVVSVYRSIAIVFDGKRDNGQTLPPGLYTALVELTSQSPAAALRKTLAVAIAGKRK